MKNKNVHILPTDKPSRLLYLGVLKELYLYKEPIGFKVFERSPQNIYITSDEEIKEGDYILIHGHYKYGKHVTKVIKITDTYEVIEGGNHSKKVCQKVILTTDQDLIKDGIQEIPDDFLEWFVKNPSCEYVEVRSEILYEHKDTYRPYPSDCKNLSKTKVNYYLSIIPKEEPKQETFEEASENYARKQCEDMYDDEGLTGANWGWEVALDFKEGAKWQAERSYSEEEVMEMFDKLSMHLPLHYEMLVREMFKKK